VYTSGDGSASDISLISKTKPEAGGGHPEVPGLDGLTLDGEDKKKGQLYSKRVLLTTYPNQPNIKPLPLRWGASDPRLRGPVLCSRQPFSLPYRNAIGALGGSYSTYRAVSIGLGLLAPDFRPDYTDTEPPFKVGPHPSWANVASFDPWGAMAQEIWKKEYAEGFDIRPTISMTMSHLKIPELDQLYREGKLQVDGKIVLKTPDLPAFPGVDQGIEVCARRPSIRFGISRALRGDCRLTRPCFEGQSTRRLVECTAS